MRHPPCQAAIELRDINRVAPLGFRNPLLFALLFGFALAVVIPLVLVALVLGEIRGDVGDVR